MTIIIHANIPEELTERPQWLLWRYIQRQGTAKPTKVPFTCMGYPADATNPDHWSRFDVALERSQRPGFCDGIGYAFSPDDPYTGIDLDNVWQSDADEGASWAMRILEKFSDTYSEVSPSGCGVKIWCRGRAPRGGSWSIEHGAIEIYDHSRYFAVTSRSNRILSIADHQEDIELLIANLDGDHDDRHDHDEGQRTQRIEGKIPHGIQHNELIRLTGALRRRGVCTEAVEACLLAVNQHQCEKPGPPENIRRIARSTKRW